MNGRVLLDTNIVIALFDGDAAVLKNLREATEVCVPAIVVGELMYGARRSRHARENLALIGEFAVASTVLACDAGTAESYGEIKAKLRRAGTPIPENDIWIAATARQHGLLLATRDGHFGNVERLDLSDWR